MGEVELKPSGTRVHYTVIAVAMLDAAGHKVTPAGDIPGLWNVAGIADDVTTGQLCQIAEQHGQWPFPLIGPSIEFQQVS
jgi:hypothetical protein